MGVSAHLKAFKSFIYLKAYFFLKNLKKALFYFFYKNFVFINTKIIIFSKNEKA